MNKIFIISGQTGIGKNYILKQLLPRLDNFQKVVTCVTRIPRPTDTEGVDHYFISEEEFKKRIEANEFLEYAYVHERLYGTPKKEVEDILSNGKDAIMEIDVQGAAQIKQKMPNVILIFLKYENGDLEQLIRHRVGADSSRNFSEEEIQKRVTSARMEETHVNEYDYVVENPEGHPEKTVDEIEKIIKKNVN